MRLQTKNNRKNKIKQSKTKRGKLTKKRAINGG
jgi:hypothetical protein